MPHVVVEYSTNLDENLSIRDLVKAVHAAVLDSGAFEVGAVRTRAAPRDVFVVADGDPDNAFINIEMRIGTGRDATTRKRVAENILEVVRGMTAEIFKKQGLGISVEIREIDNTAALRLNNLHERMKAKHGASA